MGKVVENKVEGITYSQEKETELEPKRRALSA